MQKCCTIPKFLCLGTKKLGTVQHLYSPETKKCCTVPKFSCMGTKNLGTVEHFYSPEEQKCCTVPKFLVLRHKNLGTVQHFCTKVLCCPYFLGFSSKSAVLSLKNLKKNYSPEPSGPPQPEGSGE